MHNCSQCTYSTYRKGNLERHLQTVHKGRGRRQQKGCSNYETVSHPKANHYSSRQDVPLDLKEFQPSTMSQGKTLGQQYEQAMENLESYYKEQNTKLNEALKCQQNKHHQEQCALQQQFNIEITNIQKQNNIEKENLCKKYQHFINQNGLLYQKALEKEIGKLCEQYQCCIDQNALEYQNALEKVRENLGKEYQQCIDKTGLLWQQKCSEYQQALEWQQHENNKIKDIKDDLQGCIDEYLDSENRTKEHCCEVCGARMKTNLSLLIHMRKHR